MQVMNKNDQTIKNYQIINPIQWFCLPLLKNLSISKIACVKCMNVEKLIYLIKHLAAVLVQLLGLRFNINGLKIKDLLPIMKNIHEKIQENCIALIGKVTDFGTTT
eukprot:405542_1